MGGGASGRALPNVDDLDGDIVLVVADLLHNAPQRRRRREVHATDAGEVEPPCDAWPLMPSTVDPCEWEPGAGLILDHPDENWLYDTDTGTLIDPDGNETEVNTRYLYGAPQR